MTTTARIDPAAPLILAAAAAVLYFYRLDDAPMFVGGDEAFFAINGRAIATTARDLDGRLRPLFFRIDAHTWYQPVLVYLLAISFTFARSPSGPCGRRKPRRLPAVCLLLLPPIRTPASSRATTVVVASSRMSTARRVSPRC